MRDSTQSKSKKINVYLVIGEPNMGKSTVMRHLVAFTGRNGGKALFEKELLTSYPQPFIISFYGYQALQESGISPREFIQFVQNQTKQPENLILALRLNATNGKKNTQACPDADAYIRAFIKAGWTIFKSVVLDNSGNAKYPEDWNALSVLSRPAQNAPIPTNRMAAYTRIYFGWI